MEQLNQIANDMIKLIARKNADYGNSFDEIMDTFDYEGYSAYMPLYVRLADKFNRFKTLAFGRNRQVNDETIDDTLTDLACYIILFKTWQRGRSNAS